MPVVDAHERERLIAEIDVVNDCRQEVSAQRTRDGDSRPLTRHTRQLHVQVGPGSLQQALKMGQDFRLTGGGRCHEVVVLRNSGRRSVVQGDPVQPQHHAVSHLAGLERIEVVDVYAVQEFGDIGSLDVDLAETGHIGHPDPFPHRRRLANTG